MMDLIDAEALRFRCRLNAPYHTARQEYGSLSKTATFVPGTTLRGAILTALIGRFCPDEYLAQLKQLSDPEAIAEFHQSCDQDRCPLKPFFAPQKMAWFTFGDFETGESIYGARTRIAIDRENGTAAEGALVYVENVGAGAHFDFEIILAESALDFVDQVIAAVQWAGEWQGIGRLRSTGYGRFAVENVDCVAVRKIVEEEYMRMPALDGGRAMLLMTSPYVIGRGGTGPVDGLTSELLGKQLGRHIQETVASVTYESSDPLDEFDVERADAQLKVEFIGRWSYERGMRENRLVAWSGSRLELTFSGDVLNLRESLAVASLFGIGEWSEVGYGRFRIIAGD